MYEITEDPLALEPLIAAVSDPGFGAVACFLGVVRRQGGRGEIRALDYTAYREMAREQMRRIGEELVRRRGPMKIAALHRLGRLPVGTPSLALAVGSPQRAEAFDAAAEFVDRLKEAAPIWKEDVPDRGG